MRIRTYLTILKGITKHAETRKRKSYMYIRYLIRRTKELEKELYRRKMWHKILHETHLKQLMITRRINNDRARKTG